MAGLNIPLNVGEKIAGPGLFGMLGSIANPLIQILTLGSLVSSLFGGDEPEEPPPPTWREQMQMNRQIPGPQRRPQQDPYAALRQLGPQAGQSPFVQYLQKFL